MLDRTHQLSFGGYGIPLFSGREFARSDDENAPPVAIVNRTMVERYWCGQDPIGRRLQVKGRWARVVGVVADSKYESIGETPKPFFYVPLRQGFVREPDLYIRTTQPRIGLGNHSFEAIPLPERTSWILLSNELRGADPSALALDQRVEDSGADSTIWCRSHCLKHKSPALRHPEGVRLRGR